MISKPARPALRFLSTAPRPMGKFLVAVLVAGGLLGCDAGHEAEPTTRPVAGSEMLPAPTTDAAVVYDLRFDDAARHLVDVTARFQAAPNPEVLGPEAAKMADFDEADTGAEAPPPYQDLELTMAVWTPGSYLVREYSRHVEGLTARTRGGEPLAVEKVAKNRWRVEAPPEPEVIVDYRVYAREMTVRTNFVDADLAMLNGAPTFLIPVGGEDLDHELRFHLPESWTDSAVALDRVEFSDPSVHVYRSPDFDTLVDSPVILGELDRRGFDVEGVAHELVQVGDFSRWDNVRAAEDVARLSEAQVGFWGQIPYERYLFLNVITESGGGLEHKSSTLMLTGRWRDGDERGRQRWLGLVSHELFHAWNVKRLRPAALGPFDYENENYTRSLWFVEGLTSYYGPLLLRRARLIDDQQLLDGLSRAIERTQKTEGRHVRSLADSSFDAWIKFYRPDENSRNTSVDYYGKGQVVGFLLDAEIRRATRNEGSLDKVMRLAYERFSGERGFTPQDIRDVVAEVAGRNLGDFFDRFIDGTDELDYGPALEWYGLQFKNGGGHGGGDGHGAKGDGDETAPGWLGVEARDSRGRFVVSGVPRGTPAYAAGLNVDDEILAVGEYRVDGDGWESRLQHYPPGTEAELLISRRGQLRRLAVTFGEAPEHSWKLEIESGAGSRARRHRQAWLDG